MVYLIEPRNWMYVKGCRFLSCYKFIDKIIGKDLSYKMKTPSVKCSHNLIHTAKNMPQMHLTSIKNSSSKSSKNNLRFYRK